MTKKVTKEEKKRQEGGEWGGETVHSRVPSGIRLKLEYDDCALLQYEGQRDISDKCGQEPGSIIKLAWNDGKRHVMTWVTYAMNEALPGFKVGHWYFIHHQGEVETKYNPMQDLEIRELGKTGDTVVCPVWVHPDGKITLSAQTAREANYERINYPLK